MKLMIFTTYAGILMLVCIESCVLCEKTPPPPTWPLSYKACAEMTVGQQPIRAGWYVDGLNKRVRLDSYGIPLGFDTNMVSLGMTDIGVDNKGEQNIPSVWTDEDEETRRTPENTENTEYACSTHGGAPLYIFIFRYDLNVQFNIFPSPNPPGIDCKIRNLTDIFPGSPLLPNLYHVGPEVQNGTRFNHWRASYFLYALDYWFYMDSGLPFRLYVNGNKNEFDSFVGGNITEEAFLPPDHITCTPD